MKVLTIIFGVLMAAGGIYCMLTPVTTYSALSVVIGMSMLAEGMASAITWSDLRKIGYANGWTLAGAILSIVLGAFLLGSYALQFSVDVFIAYLIAFWLVVAGIVRIATAIEARNDQDHPGASSWVVQLIFGILIVLLGILCIFNPLSVMIGVGMQMGASILIVGIALIAAGVAMWKQDSADAAAKRG